MRTTKTTGLRGGQQGFSVVEVLVAVTLLVIFVLGTVQFFASATNRIMDSSGSAERS